MLVLPQVWLPPILGLLGLPLPPAPPGLSQSSVRTDSPPPGEDRALPSPHAGPWLGRSPVPCLQAPQAPAPAMCGQKSRTHAGRGREAASAGRIWPRALRLLNSVQPSEAWPHWRKGATRRPAETLQTEDGAVPRPPPREAGAPAGEDLDHLGLAASPTTRTVPATVSSSGKRAKGSIRRGESSRVQRPRPTSLPTILSSSHLCPLTFLLPSPACASTCAHSARACSH